MKKSLDALPLIGIDTGGTFTDLVLLEGAEVRTWKLPSTPDDPARAVLEGIRHLLGDRPAVVCHGSTVATNALLEGKGAPVALVVTSGFRDLLLIGRQHRPELYALHSRRPAPLVARDNVVEVRERITAAGEVEIALEDTEIARVLAAVRADKVGIPRVLSSPCIRACSPLWDWCSPILCAIIPSPFCAPATRPMPSCGSSSPP